MSDEIKKEELPREEELKDKEIEQVSGGAVQPCIMTYCGRCKKMVKSVDFRCTVCGSPLRF